MDTTITVQENIAHPADARLMDVARRRLVKLAKKQGIFLRQSHARLGKRALASINAVAMPSRSSRTNRKSGACPPGWGGASEPSSTRLRAIGRLKTSSGRSCGRRNGCALWKPQDGTQKKIYSLHAPEVVCIGKCKARKPGAFGVKVSVAPMAALEGRAVRDAGASAAGQVLIPPIL